MNIPPIQYARTSDGYNIAYCDSGAGVPFVLMPFPFNNLHLMWQQHTNRSLYEPLAARFRLIQYDSRGQGMSSRDLSSDHTYQDYLLDLEAVIDHLQLDRFVLLGGLLSGHSAIQYAVRHPEKAHALILLNMPIQNAAGRLDALDDLALRDWETFLFTLTGVNRRQGDPRGDATSLDYFRETITQADFLSMVRAGRRSRVEHLLPQLAAPTLVVAEVASARARETAMSLAASIPDSRLVLFDGPLMIAHYTNDGAVPPIVEAIDDFLAGIPSQPEALRPTPPEAAGLLSQRELDVLRLLVAGRSNQQIADELVISLNTVRRHVSNIFDKTGAANRAQAAVYAKDHGLA